MIKISDKPTKCVEHFSGTATMVFPEIENQNWSFTVLRTTNGVTTFDVQVDLKQFEKEFNIENYNGEARQVKEREMLYCAELLEKTVKANMAKEQAEWKPTGK